MPSPHPQPPSSARAQADLAPLVSITLPHHNKPTKDKVNNNSSNTTLNNNNLKFTFNLIRRHQVVLELVRQRAAVPAWYVLQGSYQAIFTYICAPLQAGACLCCCVRDFFRAFFVSLSSTR